MYRPSDTGGSSDARRANKFDPEAFPHRNISFEVVRMLYKREVFRLFDILVEEDTTTLLRERCNARGPFDRSCDA
jgi:hypothetical protein